jgi:hypothetical protein
MIKSHNINVVMSCHITYNYMLHSDINNFLVFITSYYRHYHKTYVMKLVFWPTFAISWKKKCIYCISSLIERPMLNCVWVSEQRAYRSVPEVTCISYRNLTQKFGNTLKISKEYPTEKFNNKFCTWWFHIMFECYDQIHRGKASLKFKTLISTHTEVSHHSYLHRKTAN